MKPWIILSLLLVGLYVDRSSSASEEEETQNYDFQVQISGLSVELTCPTTGNTELKRNDIKIADVVGPYTLQNYSSDQNGLYSCGIYQLYLHAYVCETCTEVSPTMMISVAIADCLITLGVCLFVYMFCKRKPGQARESGFTKGAHKKGNKERPPPVPNPDYEPIQKRRQDVYDGLNQNLK
ncbi:T-cell surface glycoprotein CD3 epsilon chain [Leptodactylus fuscus]|uniref:T-cell surface glycoprotein CD3 epsilon chain n=1 Tax=Leptodactylus fuscus TaxID=238119 RepID=UPI003F4F0F5A